MRKSQLSQFKVLLFGALCLWPVGVGAQPRPVEKAEKVEVKAEQLRAPEMRIKDPRALFTPQEQQLVVYGLGNPIAQLLMLRELDKRFPLLPRQRFELQNLSREVTPKLNELRGKRARQERALEEATYGAHFDAAAIEVLADESAATQEELAKLQGVTELRLLQIYARNNPRRVRTARAFIETLLRPQPQRPLPQLLLARPNAGPMRFLAEFFGDNWDLIVPGFGNPAAFLLILNQLELTPEQKVELKALSQSVRTELQKELQERNQQQAGQQQAGQQQAGQQQGNREPADTEEPELQPSRQEMVLQIVAANAARQGRQLKRQARIETRIRQIMQPKQWDTYVTLLRGLAGAGAIPMLPNANGKKMMRQPDALRPQPPVPETE